MVHQASLKDFRIVNRIGQIADVSLTASKQTLRGG
jgi:hypothetical protein